MTFALYIRADDPIAIERRRLERRERSLVRASNKAARRGDLYTIRNIAPRLDRTRRALYGEA